MFFSTSILAVVFASLVQAQAPSGFRPQAANKLEVIFNTTMVNYPGQQLARNGMYFEYSQNIISDLSQLSHPNLNSHYLVP
jgi:hypothetical protein